jgi:hypothetical protein
MPRELPRRVVAVDQMWDDEFARHCALRHPALKKRLRTRDGHLAAHRDWPHAHVHCRTEAAEAEPRSDVAYMADVTG